MSQRCNGLYLWDCSHQGFAPRGCPYHCRWLRHPTVATCRGNRRNQPHLRHTSARVIRKRNGDCSVCIVVKGSNVTVQAQDRMLHQRLTQNLRRLLWPQPRYRGRQHRQARKRVDRSPPHTPALQNTAVIGSPAQGQATHAAALVLNLVGTAGMMTRQSSHPRNNMSFPSLHRLHQSVNALAASLVKLELSRRPCFIACERLLPVAVRAPATEPPMPSKVKVT